MEFSVSDELTGVAFAIIFGAAAATVFFLFRFFRMAFRNSKPFCIFTDIFFWIVFAFFAVIFFVASGGVTLSSVLAVFFGFFLFLIILRKTFTRLKYRYCERLSRFFSVQKEKIVSYFGKNGQKNGK